MIVAGLDTGTTSGLAILRDRELVHAESFRPKGDTDGPIFRGIHTWLFYMLITHKVESLAFEQPLRTDISIAAGPDHNEFGEFASRKGAKKPIGNMNTFLRLYGIRAVVLEVCEALNITPEEVNNRTWRSAIYGSGFRPPATVKTSERSAWWKTQALNRCKLLKWNIKSKDAAEGALIADYHMAMLNPRLVTEDLFTRERATA